MRQFTRLIVLSALFAVIGHTAFAQTIAVQGVLRGPLEKIVSDGSYSVTFRLYDQETGGSQIWSETLGNVQVQHGVFSVELGGTSSLSSLGFDNTYWLGISINSSAELAPRVKFTNTAYAMSVMGTSNIFPSSGNVGIGTTTPATKLYVSGSSNTYVTVNTTSNGKAGLAFDADKAREWEIARNPDKSLRITESGVGDAVTIQPGGNVGIGTASPESKVHVGGNVKTDGQIRAAGDTSGLKIGDDFFIGGIDSTRTGIKTGDDWRVTVMKDGKVGIGTTNPAQALHVNGNLKIATPDGKIVFSDGSTLSTASLGETAGSLAGYGDIFITADSDADNAGAIKFTIADSTHMVVTPDGRVGVGTKDPAYSLDVNGDIGVSGTIMENGVPFSSDVWSSTYADTIIVKGNTLFESFESGTTGSLVSSLPGWRGYAYIRKGESYHGSQGVSIGYNTYMEVTLIVDTACQLIYYVLMVNEKYLRVYRDGSVYESIRGHYSESYDDFGEWREHAIPLQAGTHTIKWQTDSDAAAWVDFIFTTDYSYTGPSAHYTGGNVGIGTSSPQNALEVGGSLNAERLMIDGKFLNAEPEKLWDEGSDYISYNTVNAGCAVSFGKDWGTQPIIYFGVTAESALIEGVVFTTTYLYPESGTSGASNTWFGLSSGLGTSGVTWTHPWGNVYVNRVDCYASWDYSDHRLKRNIRPLQHSLEKILRLKGVKYNINPETHPFYVNSEDKDAIRARDRLGFIGQDLKDVIPEMVEQDETSGLYMIVNEHQMYPVLTEAIKELKTDHLDLLEKEVGKLEEELERLLEEHK